MAFWVMKQSSLPWDTRMPVTHFPSRILFWGVQVTLGMDKVGF